MLENIRINAEEKRALLYAIKGVGDEVYLLGSCVNPIQFLLIHIEICCWQWKSKT